MALPAGKEGGTLELLVRGADGVTRLLAPDVGYLTCARAEGELLGPGQEAGVLLRLGRPFRLVVPAGVRGRVAGARPRPVHAPVAYGDVVVELAPLGAGDEAAAGAVAAAPSADGGRLFVLSSQSGRFYHRPAPERPPFVEPGAVIEDGVPIGLIEVMKTFAHVPYRAPAGSGLPRRARVVALLVDDGGEVCEGQPLLEVEPAPAPGSTAIR